MYPLHSLRHRQKDFLRVLPLQRPGLFQVLFQRLPLNKFHDNVGGIIFLKQIQHLHHLKDFTHLGHFPGFLEEHLLAVDPGHSGLLGIIPLQSIAGTGVAAHLPGGIILLDRHLPLQRQIPANIGDAKAALPQDLADQVFTVQDCPGTEGIIQPSAAGIIAAHGTGISPDFLHAAKTAIDFHLFTSPYFLSSRRLF